jgi:alkyl hydroperoxide reductase subunit AhpC
MTIALGATAPDFTAASTQGEIRLHEYIGNSWCFFFAHPRDFSAVCMTELAAVARLKARFDERNVKVLSLGMAGLDRHLSWAADFEPALGCQPNFPMIADPNGEVAALYGMIHPQHMAGVATRCHFIIDPNKTIRLYAVYPTTVGRQFDEILRCIDSLQLTARRGLVTPADWKPGEKGAIPPALNDEQARAKFPEGWEAVTPYLRLIQP